MTMIKKSLFLASLLSISPITNAGTSYMVISCNMNPATTLPASYTDPNTGLTQTAPSCGEALMKVPQSFDFMKASAAGTSSAAFVSYLFTKNPFTAKQKN